MTLFLTSSPSGCPFEPGPDIPVLDTRNHFVANLRAVWPDHAVLGLAIAADPYAYEQNDEMCRVFAQSFANAHLPLTALIPCDARNAEEIGSPSAPKRLCDAVRRARATPEPLFCSAGPAGAVPQLPRHRAGRECRQHERRPHRVRRARGTGRSRRPALLPLDERPWPDRDPHPAPLPVHPDHVLDGQKMEDIALADSKKRHFLALPDGSYILCADGSEALYGRGWYFADGMMEEINEDEDVLPLR